MSRKSKDRGRGFEYRVAKFLGGTRRLLSRGGDVMARGFVGECKYRSSTAGLVELKSWIDQAKENGKKAGLPWFVCFTFGGRSGKYVIIELETFEERTREGD